MLCIIVWSQINEIFTLDTYMDTIGAPISLATQKMWRIYCLDAKSTFLNVCLNEEIHME